MQAPISNAAQQRKGPELVDFFGSIDPTPPQAPQPQQQMYAQPPSSFLPTIPQHSPFSVQAPTFPQSFGTTQQSSNPFGQFQQPQPQQQQQQQQQMPASHLQSQFTGAGFGGYTAQPQQFGFDNQQPTDVFGAANGNTFQSQFPPQFMADQSQPQMGQQTTNPFRQSTGQPQGGSAASPIAAQMTGRNPFAHANTQQQGMGQPMQYAQPETQFQALPQVSPVQPLYPQQTGTNPFARGTPSNMNQQQPTSPTAPTFGSVVSHATGSTNPFRQSAFVNQQTGQGWQAGPQGSMGGLEQLPTIPIFPRPGQPQQQQSPWGM